MHFQSLSFMTPILSHHPQVGLTSKNLRIVADWIINYQTIVNDRMKHLQRLSWRQGAFKPLRSKSQWGQLKPCNGNDAENHALHSSRVLKIMSETLRRVEVSGTCTTRVLSESIGYSALSDEWMLKLRTHRVHKALSCRKTVCPSYNPHKHQDVARTWFTCTRTCHVTHLLAEKSPKETSWKLTNKYVLSSYVLVLVSICI